MKGVKYGEFLDSRDLEERREELENIESRDEEEEEEFILLTKLKEECEGYGWEDGITFISEYEVNNYFRELAEDCGYLTNSGYNTNSNPLLNYIDWDSWERDCLMDYTETKIKDTVYYFREC